MSKEKWYRIAKHNGQARYGYGTYEDAVKYTDLLDGKEGNDVDCYQVTELDNQDLIDDLESGDNTSGFDIADEIAWMEGD